MGYFDALTNASFKPDTDGNTLFFPYGAWGKGRLIADSDSAEQLKKFISRFYIIAVGCGIILVLTVGYIWSFIAFPFLMLWYHQGIKKFLKDAPYSDAKLTTRESMQNVASGMNKYLLWFFLLGSLLFAAMSVFLVIETGDLFLGLGGIFFGLCGFVFVVMLRSKKK